MERIFQFSGVPFEWICQADNLHDARTVIQAIRNMEPQDRLPALTLPADIPNETIKRLETISKSGRWTAEEKNEIVANFGHGARVSGHGFDTLLDTWRSLAEWGARYMEALEEYHQVFFAEEELRIRPAMEVGLLHAQVSAQKHTPVELVEELSRGVRLENPESLASITLFASWWVAPLAFLIYPEPGKLLMAFDVRSGSKTGGAASEAPEALVAALKALGDPTRLKILKYLAVEPLAPSELARRLRLRPPTVIHHLRQLRFAGLVQVTVSEKLDKRYAARLEELQSITTSLKDFLNFNG